jgi:Calcium binding
MRTPRRSPTREARIHNEIIVDAYGPGEQAMGWYYYLDDHLRFPFDAQCITERAISPLKKGETVTVVSMAPEEECEHEMFVRVRWQGRSVAVPLVQLRGRRIDSQTRQAIADWHYWVEQGYIF